MPLVGDPERDRAVSILRRAYANGYLELDQLEPRVDAAIRARSGRDLASSVRGIPGGQLELAVDGYVLPAVRAGTLGLRVRVVRFLLWVVYASWAALSLVLLGIFSVWALVAGPPIAAGAALLVVWLIASAGALAARRTARKLTVPYGREVGHRR